MSRLNMGVMVPLCAAIVFGSTFACDRPAAPSPHRCVDDWNTRAGSSARDRVTEGEFQSAWVRGWLAENTYPGCGIVFITSPNEPWLSCARTFQAAVARLTEWSCEAGPQPGLRQTLSPDFRANAMVGSNSQLALSGST
jgi:hypothetical protein